MRRANAGVMLVAALAVGCYDVHSVVGDGAAPGMDGGGPPYDAAACPPLGGYERCGPGCGDRWCDGPLYCNTLATVCAPSVFATGELDRRFDGCAIQTEWPPGESPRGGHYCADDRVCVGTRRDFEDGDATFRGKCLREEFCDDAAGVVEGFACVWSDLSERRSGAPVDALCPSSDPRAGLCGGPCGDCPWDPPRYYRSAAAHFQVSCVGRSDERGIGICAQHTLYLCVPGTEFTADLICGNQPGFPAPPLLGSDPCACLLLEDPNAPGAFLPWGWATLGATCRQYRELYPGQVRCLDGEWDEIE